MRFSLFGLLWLVIGAVIALSHGYAVTDVTSLLSFCLATLLWPLILLGMNFHLAL